MTTPICKVPWVTIQLAGNGDIKPCCVYKSGGPSIHRGDTLDSVWKDLDKLRQDFLDGKKPEACQACWKREETLGTSRRMWYDNKIENWPEQYTLNPEMKLRHMDLNFGNVCNLKCRMCGSWGSTTWFKEDKKLMDIDPTYQRQISNLTPTMISAEYWADKKELFQSLERIDFKGGEPLMQEGMYDFLEYLVEWGYASNITIAYTTNGTQTPERLKDLWPKFKRVRLVISVEGSGKLYEYIRGGEIQTPEQLEENIRWYDQFENVKGSFNTAISIYNIFDLNNMLEWVDQKLCVSDRWWTDPETFIFDCLVTGPPYLDINIMPDDLKQRAISIIEEKNYKSLDTIKKALSRSSYDERLWNLFINFTNDLDKMRKTDVRQVIPELRDYFL